MHDDFQTEPVKGLPEAPPPEEQILWQGAPDWKALAREALNVNWVAGYFVLLAIWRGVTIFPEGGLALAMKAATPFIVMGFLACAIIAGMAWIMARATIYTITNRRVAMRIGAALTVTLNIPFKQMETAGLDLKRRGTGTIAMRLKEGNRFSFLVCWPHTRPWTFNPAQPALRCIPGAAAVAELLADAAETRLNEVTLEKIEPNMVAAE